MKAIHVRNQKCAIGWGEAVKLWFGFSFVNVGVICMFVCLVVSFFVNNRIVFRHYESVKNPKA